MKRLLITIASLLLIAGCYGCSDDFLEPTVELKAEIPPDYITYTSEGLFSVSYPPDLIIDTERMETYAEIPLKEIRPVFDGYIPCQQTYIPQCPVSPRWRYPNHYNSGSSSIFWYIAIEHRTNLFKWYFCVSLHSFGINYQIWRIGNAKKPFAGIGDIVRRDFCLKFYRRFQKII